MGKLLTPEQVCERYSIKKSTLYQWTAKNFIPHLKIGGLVRFREEVLERWEVNTVKAELVWGSVLEYLRRYTGADAGIALKPQMPSVRG